MEHVLQYCVLHFTYFYVISDPKQRLVMFRKLEEMSRVHPVAFQPKLRPARLDYFKGTKLNVTYVPNICFCVLYYTPCIYDTT